MRCWKDISSTMEGVSRSFCFWKFIVACHSLQLPEQKEGLFSYKLCQCEYWILPDTFLKEIHFLEERLSYQVAMIWKSIICSTKWKVRWKYFTLCKFSTNKHNIKLNYHNHNVERTWQKFHIPIYMQMTKIETNTTLLSLSINPAFYYNLQIISGRTFSRYLHSRNIYKEVYVSEYHKTS